MSEDSPQAESAPSTEGMLSANRDLWDRWTDLHVESDFYAVDRFLQGETSLRSIELEELTEVDGKSLLHLQCHFGLDTLSWARLGAEATGVDLSPRAVERGRELADRAGLEATFEAADVLELDLGRTFDIVFTSYGVVDWLKDLDQWARIVARHLRPDGRFYMVEFHPLVGILSEDGRRIEESYFPTDDPIAFAEQGSYADPEAPISATSYTWPHSLGEIVTALISAGLRLDFLHEFPFSPYDCFPCTKEVAPGKAIIPGMEGKIPLCFSLQARHGG